VNEWIRKVERCGSLAEIHFPLAVAGVNQFAGPHLHLLHPVASLPGSVVFHAHPRVDGYLETTLTCNSDSEIAIS
jgi:hypothetical protein